MFAVARDNFEWGSSPEGGSIKTCVSPRVTKGMRRPGKEEDIKDSHLAGVRGGTDGGMGKVRTSKG